MTQFSAKLSSISFFKSSKACYPTHLKLLLWIFPCAALMVSCLSFIYIIPLITESPLKETDVSLNVTLFDTFSDVIHKNCDNEDPFCDMTWVKLTFFGGFAVSHFSMGFLADYFGRWTMMKISAKSLIFVGVLITLQGNMVLYCKLRAKKE